MIFYAFILFSFRPAGEHSDVLNGAADLGPFSLSRLPPPSSALLLRYDLHFILMNALNVYRLLGSRALSAAATHEDDNFEKKILSDGEDVTRNLRSRD